MSGRSGAVSGDHPLDDWCDGEDCGEAGLASPGFGDVLKLIYRDFVPSGQGGQSGLRGLMGRRRVEFVLLGSTDRSAVRLW